MKRTFVTLCVTAAIVAMPALAAPDASAHDLLQKIQFQAVTTERDAGRLNSYTSDQLDWMAQGLELTKIQDDVNALGRTVRRVQMEDANAMTPDQQATLNRIGRRVNLLANDTQDAILYGRSHRDLLWNPGYNQDVQLLYQNSERLVHEAHTVLQREG
ncbi:MAG TPA: hypothetical protein VMG40_13990 [Bryobacteraceae bacterium]|nr:hypothetical protein [Bryobacteraceae bacterium]